MRTIENEALMILSRINRKNEKFKTSIPRGLCLLPQFKYALLAKLKCLKVILTS